MAMRKGTVKWFSEQKGYGFISPEDGGADVFVHYTSIEQEGKERRNLEESEKVQFEVVNGPKGLQASAVRRI